MRQNKMLASEENYVQCCTVSQIKHKSGVVKGLMRYEMRNLVGQPVCSAAQGLPHEVNGTPEIGMLTWSSWPAGSHICLPVATGSR